MAIIQKVKNPNIILLMIILMVMNSVMFSDMYVPSMPHITAYFHTSAVLTKYTITVFFLAFGFSMLIYGPLSDAFGRRSILLIGLSISLLGSAISVLANSIDMLILGRFIQGLGISVVVCLGRVMARDLSSSNQDLANKMAYVSTAIGLAPAIAPTLGGYLQHYFEWRFVFEVILSVSILIFMMAFFLLPETHQNIRRDSITRKVVLQNYYTVGTNSIFWANLSCAIAGFAGIMVYYTMTPFLFENKLGLTAVQYGLFTLLTAGMMLIGRFGNALLIKKLDPEKVLSVGLTLMLLGSGLMLTLYLLGFFNIMSIVISMAIFTLGTGFVFSNALVGAFAPFKNILGFASGLYSSTQMLAIFAATLIAANLPDSSPLALSIVLFSMSLVATILRGSLRPKQSC